MALIVCKNCGKDISNKAEKCIHCGTPIDKPIVPLDKPIVSPVVNNVKPIAYQSQSTNRFDFKAHIPNIIFTLILLFMLYFLGGVKTTYSGTYSVMKFIKWGLRTYFNLSSIIVVFDLFVIVYLIVCAGFLFGNKVLKTLAKIGYILLLVAEVLFMCVIGLISRFSLDFEYFIILGFSIFWVIFVFKKYSTKPVMAPMYQMPIMNTNIPKEEEKKDESLDELKKLKELYDSKAITKEEYQQMKDTVMETFKKKRS